MHFEHDGSGNAYVELHSWNYGGKKEFFRITRVEKEVGKVNYRFQIRKTNGQLRAMGPEFPVEGVEDLINALLKIKEL
ncbi:hypothetical protein [Peribacillus sp. YIM B13477]|uniref:hypothetical protein n=1 Tax=Peribacillus sp. YIM B13477 TaxID=3366300 RepID=UPI00366CC611